MKYVYKFIMEDGTVFDAASDVEPEVFLAELRDSQNVSAFIHLDCQDKDGRHVDFEVRPTRVAGLAILPIAAIEAANNMPPTGPILHRPN